mmetsp:Transcript_31591/g.26616  ORF Transcript_31591/g.26616 Transcript_31591/m.26616 type:complete len:338 (-) Transcript_31591:86-1099(-)
MRMVMLMLQLLHVGRVMLRVMSLCMQSKGRTGFVRSSKHLLLHLPLLLLLLLLQKKGPPSHSNMAAISLHVHVGLHMRMVMLMLLLLLLLHMGWVLLRVMSLRMQSERSTRFKWPITKPFGLPCHASSFKLGTCNLRRYVTKPLMLSVAHVAEIQGVLLQLVLQHLLLLFVQGLLFLLRGMFLLKLSVPLVTRRPDGGRGGRRMRRLAQDRRRARFYNASAKWAGHPALCQVDCALAHLLEASFTHDVSARLQLCVRVVCETDGALFRIQLFCLFASVLRLEKHTTDAPIWSTLALRIEQGLGCPSFLLSAGWHLLLRLQWRLQRRLLRRLRRRLLC